MGGRGQGGLGPLLGGRREEEDAEGVTDIVVTVVVGEPAWQAWGRAQSDHHGLRERDRLTDEERTERAARAASDWLTEGGRARIAITKEGPRSSPGGRLLCVLLCY